MHLCVHFERMLPVHSYLLCHNFKFHVKGRDVCTDNDITLQPYFLSIVCCLGDSSNLLGSIRHWLPRKIMNCSLK